MTGAFSLAVHALVYLNDKATTLSSEMLAENICTNPARIRKVMSQLKRAGLISTKEGIDGGYHFEGNIQSITLRQIAEAVDARVCFRFLALRQRGQGLSGCLRNGADYGRYLRPAEPGLSQPAGTNYIS